MAAHLWKQIQASDSSTSSAGSLLRNLSFSSIGASSKLLIIPLSFLCSHRPRGRWWLSAIPICSILLFCLFFPPYCYLVISCLENPMGRGTWWAAVHGVAKSQTRLSDFTFTFTFMHRRRKWQPTPVFLPGESQGWRSLVGCRRSGRTESDMTDAT